MSVPYWVLNRQIPAKAALPCPPVLDSKAWESWKMLCRPHVKFSSEMIPPSAGIFLTQTFSDFLDASFLKVNASALARETAKRRAEQAMGKEP